jgi:hypothetical protein
MTASIALIVAGIFCLSISYNPIFAAGMAFLALAILFGERN